jgi:SH3 domain
MTPLIKGIVIAASVIFGLIFLALVTRKLFQLRRRQRRVSWADNISPFAPTVNEAGYEKPLPQAPAQAPAPAPVPAPPPSRMYGSQDAGYGTAAGVGYGLGPGYGANPDYAYQNYAAQSQTMRPYSPAVPSSAGYGAPFPYNTAGGMGAGAAAAAAVGAGTMAYNSNSMSAAPPPAPMPNPFAVNAVDTAGPIPINASVAPPAGQQILVVKRTFAPSLPDELPIVTGESVRVLAVFDDGWCRARKLGPGGEEGVVPYECLEISGTQGALGTVQNDQMRRASSLYDAPRAQTQYDQY